MPLHHTLSRQRGLTLIELVVTLTLISVLAMVVVPLYDMAIKRHKETELREALHQVRDALDAYKAAADNGYIAKEAGGSGYPPDLQTLVEGVDTLAQPLTTTAAGGATIGQTPPNAAAGFNGTNPAAGVGANGTNGANAGTATAPTLPPHLVFLRSIPRDPFADDPSAPPDKQWNLRAYGNAPDDYSEGADVYDISSKSTALGINGVAYKDW
jgi:general secretion pathway protein G